MRVGVQTAPFRHGLLPRPQGSYGLVVTVTVVGVVVVIVLVVNVFVVIADVRVLDVEGVQPTP